MKWWETRKKDDETEEVVLPKAIQDQLDEVKGLKATVETQATQLSKLDGISAYIEEQRAERAEAARKRATPPTPTAEEEQERRQRIAALLLEDPEAAYAELGAKTNAGLLQIAANMAKREVFEDQAEKFPYYTGEVKAEINKILSAQPLNFQTNHQAIENTYYTVVGKMQKDITEGKIKDRFASSTSSRSTETAEELDRKKITVNDDIRKIAGQLGMSVEDYTKLLEEDVERYV